jgi:hypothetical protein
MWNIKSSNTFQINICCRMFNSIFFRRYFIDWHFSQLVIIFIHLHLKHLQLYLKMIVFIVVLDGDLSWWLIFNSGVYLMQQILQFFIYSKFPSQFNTINGAIIHISVVMSLSLSVYSYHQKHSFLCACRIYHCCGTNSFFFFSLVQYVCICREFFFSKQWVCD